MSAALAAAQAALQAALQQQQQGQPAASMAHNAQADKLSCMSSRNSNLLKHLQFQGRLRSCLACPDFSQEQLAAAATRGDDLRWGLAVAVKVEQSYAANMRCLCTKEALTAHRQGRLAESQQKQEVQNLQTQHEAQQAQQAQQEVQRLAIKGAASAGGP
ncbi:hypothetical protein ABBQ32_011131 [Trebouxia sp. C0010 RCD-2024]